MKLKHGTWVIVADGRKFLVLHNKGDTEFTDLRVIAKSEIENPPSREHGTDRPGRMPDDSRSGRSAMEETDWHDLEERRFGRDLAARLDEWAQAKRFDELVVIADPRSLGTLRGELSDRVRNRIVREVGKDVTHQTVTGIEATLNAL